MKYFLAPDNYIYVHCILVSVALSVNYIIIQKEAIKTESATERREKEKHLIQTLKPCLNRLL